MIERVTSPELIRERMVRLLELYDESGAEKIPDEAIGIHGTSIEALENLVQSGALVGKTDMAGHHDRGDIFFAPRLENLSSVWSERLKNDPLEPEAAEQYASMAAKRMALLSALGLDFSNSHNYEMALNLADDGRSAEEILANKNMDWAHLFIQNVGPENFNKAVEVARKYEGVTIAISKTALDEFEVDLGDDWEHDLKIATGAKGLSLQHISIIKAHGQGEKEFFEELRSKLIGKTNN